MKVFDINRSDNPYELDRFSYDKSIVALTRKNSAFIEAVVALDSNYSRETQIVAPSHGYDPELHYSNADGKYCGSSMYWFEQMQLAVSEEYFRRSVLGAVIAVDTTNSTHLSAAEDGRKQMRDIICDACKSTEELIAKLNVDYSPFDEKHLINLMNVPLKAAGREGVRFNLSFASKFCSYASKFYKCNIEYPKYDNVVARNLPLYIEAYLGEHVKKLCFLMPGNNTDVESKKSQESLIYRSYWDYIERIIAILPHEDVVTKEQFDHIVWYTKKGK